MTGKEFLNHIVNGEVDLLALLLAIFEESGTDYCVIGGLAVNAYADPVVSLDLDVVVGLKVEEFEHSVNLSLKGSDLRIQLQTDPRYQAFVNRATPREVLGYRMKVAAVEDVLKGKVWAFSDDGRRASKRQKDLADIMRLVETQPELMELLPESVRSRF
jgi:hypothetical protein